MASTPSGNLATCEVCREGGESFQVPWGDHIGPAIMRAHFQEKHPEIVLDSQRDRIPV